MSEMIDALRAWVGKSEQAEERADAWPVIGLAAALDQPREAWPVEGEPISPTAHWCYFSGRVAQSALDHDGHPHRGGVIPPFPMPRRMWAGSRLAFHLPIRIGDTISLTTAVSDVSVKEGRSGTLGFVTLAHTWRTSAGVARVEHQDLVYREPPDPAQPAPPAREAPRDADWSASYCPDAAQLFRYSAVTFNAHRIHYDLAYATTVEGYPGLVVHGPLIATLLLQTWQQQHPHAVLQQFAFRAVSPLFCGERLHAEGRRADAGESALWARHDDGRLLMQATVRWA